MKVLMLNGSPHKEGCTYTALSEVAKSGTAPWISVDVDAQRGTFNALPRREEVTDLADVKEQLVVELYSK